MGLITNALLAIKIKSGHQRQRAPQCYSAKLTTARHHRRCRRRPVCATSISECVQQHAEESAQHAEQNQDQEVNLFEFVADHSPSSLSNERARPVESASKMETAAGSRHERRHQARLFHYQRVNEKHHTCHEDLGPSSASISQERRNQRRAHSKRPQDARKTSILQQMFLVTFGCLLLTTTSLNAYEHHHHHEHHHKKHYEAPIVKVIHKTVHIPKAIPVPKFIPVPKYIPVPKTVAVPHPVHISVKVPIYKTVKKLIPVPKPVHVHKPVPVPKPYAVAVPVPVFKHHPYPVYKHVPVHKPYGVPVPYKVHKHVPVGYPKVVHVPKPYPVHYKVPVYKEVIVKKPVEVPVPVYIKKKPVYHPPVYKHVHKKHHEHHHGHGHYAAATNDQFMAVQPGAASANIQQQAVGGGSLSPAASHQQTLMMTEQPNGQQQQQGQAQYSQYMQANHQAMSNRDNWPTSLNDNNTGDKMRGMAAAAHQQVVADQQQQQQQQMMVAASNMDQSSPTSAQADLITQGSSPPGSSAGQRPSQASHARHQPQSASGGPDPADAINGLQAGGEFSAPNHQMMSAAPGDKQNQFQNHQLEPAKSGKLSRGPGSLEMMVNGPFHYQTAGSMIGVGNSNKSIFSPRHLMMAQASNLSPSTLVQAPIQFNAAGGSSSGANTNLNPLDQLSSSASDTQQVFAVQQPQQPRNAILNQLTKLWSIVGKQRSLLPSITSPFSSKQATLNQRQLQLLMNNPIAKDSLESQQQQQSQMNPDDSLIVNAPAIVK